MVDLSDVYNKVKTLCTEIPSNEWSGFIFYTYEGNLFEEVTCKVIDLILLDIDSPTYTEFDPGKDERFMDYAIDKGYLGNDNIKIGLMHSHQSMSVFFSGTDESTLIEHGLNFDMFLSVIVNNRLEVESKLAFTIDSVLKASKIPSQINTSMLGIISGTLSKDREVLQQIKVQKELKAEKRKSEYDKMMANSKPMVIPSFEWETEDPLSDDFGTMDMTSKEEYEQKTSRRFFMKKDYENLMKVKESFILDIIIGRLEIYDDTKKVDLIPSLFPYLEQPNVNAFSKDDTMMFLEICWEEGEAAHRLKEIFQMLDLNSSLILDGVDSLKKMFLDSNVNPKVKKDIENYFRDLKKEINGNK